MAVDIIKPKNSVWFGTKTFAFDVTYAYYDKLFSTMTYDEIIAVKTANPHCDIIRMEIVTNFNNKTNKFYNIVQGVKCNVTGQFDWSIDYIMEILNSNNVPNVDIPDYLRNYKTLETLYSTTKLTIYTDAKTHPTYNHTVENLQKKK